MTPQKQTTAVCGRFAPTPSGRMHAGNVLTALISWLSARSQGGTWILRHEDLDTARCKRENALQIEDDLRWLGLHWDAGGIADNCFQSLRYPIYDAYFEQLRTCAELYPCFCRRADLMAANAPHASDGRVIYNGKCRSLSMAERRQLSENQQPAWRIAVPDADIHFRDKLFGEQCINLSQACGDFVVRRADGVAAYQLAVVIDDALMGVTEVVRGSDLLLSAAQQLFLYQQFTFRQPTFAHVPLLCNNDGIRLSKRDTALDLGYLRAHNTPEQLIGKLAHTIGLTETSKAISANELLDVFSWERITPHHDLRISNLD